MNPYCEPLWHFLYDWQTLLTGIIALVAAIATIVVTRLSTGQELSAAQAQTKAAQEQIRVTIRTEQRRIAREGYAFAAMVVAAMELLADEVNDARSNLPKSSVGAHSREAYRARQALSMTGFEDIRSGCVRLGGQMATPFLRLEAKIKNFRAQYIEAPTGLDPPTIPLGLNRGLIEALDAILSECAALRDTAAESMRRSTMVLAETNDLIAP